MAQVRAMTGAIQPTLEEITITQNGIYTPPSNVDGYNKITALFPIPVIVPKVITSNGVYNASDDHAEGYSSVSVAVQPTLYNPGEITQNGEYPIPSGYDGFSAFSVNVSGSDVNNKYFEYISTRSNRSQSSDIYTCKIAGKYLAINIDIINESGTTHSSIATISSTGTVADYAELYTSYGSNNNRDCTIRCSIIDVEVGDTVTFTNSTSNNHVSRLHALIPTDMTGIDANWIDTVTDNARDNTINKSGSTSALLICAQSSGENASNTDASITNPVNVDNILSSYNNGMSINIGFTDANWSCTYNTANITNYASKIYAIFDISQ